MQNIPGLHNLKQCLEVLKGEKISPLEFLPEGNLAEKLIALVLTGTSNRLPVSLSTMFQETLAQLEGKDTSQINVVVLGGGTGLSNIVGGDSRRADWGNNPFTGLKEIFHNVTSIVCVTDDGGSTGELLKYLPLPALGDLRHVLLSSIRRIRLCDLYQLDDQGAQGIASQLHSIFNYRFNERPQSSDQLLESAGLDALSMSDDLYTFLRRQAERLFTDRRMAPVLNRPQCLGNLLLASTILDHLDSSLTCEDIAAEHKIVHDATLAGLRSIAVAIGAEEQAVLPCTTTSAHLQMLYANGVLVTGEHKSSIARRGYPVERAIVEFLNTPCLPDEVVQAMREADIIIYAPGSLYTSIIPVFQVPGFADLIRANQKALKVLVSNIWAQKGETDAARDAPDRKFFVSDLIRAYDRNIPGGVENLFNYILTLGLRTIPGSVLQNYALEEKQPIYLDRKHLREIGFEPIEAGIFSIEQLRRRHVIQHDPEALALAVRTLWCLEDACPSQQKLSSVKLRKDAQPFISVNKSEHPEKWYKHPCIRYEAIQSWLNNISISTSLERPGKSQSIDNEQKSILLDRISEIIWHHPDIPVEHLHYARSLVFIDSDQWSRSQQWDNIFSFYAPEEKAIMIRSDLMDVPERFEMAFLVALGQSLLGNYAAEKAMQDVIVNNDKVGHIFQLTLRNPNEWNCYLRYDELKEYLELSRMQSSSEKQLLYTRLVSGDEGFTPPGLLFGLFYTWYLDNRFASHIEYKMSIMRNDISDLIPEQIRIVGRREGLIHFFREKVFRQNCTLGRE